MKNIVLVFTFLFSSGVNFLFGQELNSISGQAIYSKKIEYNKNIKDAKTKKFYSDLSKVMEELEYYLTINNNESIFYFKDRMVNDSNPLHKFSRSIASGNGVRYINTSTNLILHQKKSFGKTFLISKKISTIKWKLTKEKRVINGYNCLKATTTVSLVNSRGNIKQMDVLAWYSPDISISSGPLGFSGLPGLILRLDYGKYTYEIIKFEYNYKDKVTIKKPSKGTKITSENFLKLEKKMALSSREFLKD